MTTVRRINVSKIEGDGANNSSTDEIRPNGEMALYVGDNNKLELLIADGVRTNVKNKVLNKGTFYGGDADSSDGLNRDTIKLVPDEELRRNGSDQYLVIDPTVGEPGHIHVRAGGEIDQSTADLFLGGEVNNVRVSDVSNGVSITSFAGFGNLTYTWNFNTNGDLVFPGATSRIGESEPGLVIFSDNGFAIQANASTESSKSWVFEPNGALRFPNSASIEDTISVLAAGTKITVPLNAAGDTEDYVGGASVLEIPKNTDTNQVQAGWIITFSNDVQRTVTEVVDGGSYWAVLYAEANPGLGSSTYPLDIQSADYTAGSDGNLTVSITGRDGLNVNFTFGADGNLSLPSNLTIASLGNFAPAAGTYAVQAANELLGLISTGNIGSTQLGWTENAFAPGNISAIGFNVGGARTVDVTTGDYTSTVNTWSFRDNGELVFPSGGNVTFDSSAVSVIDGVTSVKFADNTTQTTAWTGTVAYGNTIAIGYSAGIDQGEYSIAIGSEAGATTQGNLAVAVGRKAGSSIQGDGGVAVGESAGWVQQGEGAVALGREAGLGDQGVYAVAVGYNAGADTQGAYAIAIGYGAGTAFQPANSVIINSSADSLNASTTGLFINPIRNTTGNVGVLQYNNVTKEVSYSSNVTLGNVTAGNLTVNGNIIGNVAGFSIGYRDVPQISAGNVTLGLTDAGKHYYATTSAPTTLTIPSNANVAFPIGTAITIVNAGAGNITVGKEVEANLYLAGNSTSATRTLTSYGMATLLKTATNEWFINGTGLA